jgi:DNA-binding NarL/FixJ family response regulator
MLPAVGRHIDIEACWSQALKQVLDYGLTATMVVDRAMACRKTRGPEWATKWGAANMVRILLADGQAVVRRGLRALLEARQGFEVCAEASSGCEAAALALQQRPDVAILDIALPIVNGIEATRKIRREASGTEVMIFTLEDGESEIRSVLLAGARGYVLKSESDEEIIRAVETLALHHSYFSHELSRIVFDNIFEHPRSDRRARSLTARERNVVQLIAEGNSNKNIGQMLNINIHSTSQLVRYAFRERIVQP